MIARDPHLTHQPWRLLCLLLAGLVSPPSIADKTEDLKEIGDYVQILLPGSALGTAVVKRDWEGAYQMIKVIGAGAATAQVGKRIVGRVRPDSSDEHSFPSGHTSAAFMAPDFFRIRYNTLWSIPAYVAAGFVGYTRIRGNKHYRDDVLAGATNGMMWNWLLVSPQDADLQLMPVATDDGLGIQLKANLGGRPRGDSIGPFGAPIRYVFEFGAVDPYKHDVQAPRDSGTPLDFATAQDEPDVTSRVTLEHQFAPRHEWGLYLAPMETIDYGLPSEFTETLHFGGVDFEPVDGAFTSVRYRFLEARLNYRYSLITTDTTWLRLGGSLQYLDNRYAAQQFFGDPRENNIIAAAVAQEHTVRPLANLRSAYRFARRWIIDLELDTYPLGDWYYNAGVIVRYQPSPAWTLGLGGRWFGSELSTSELKMRIEAFSFVAQISHAFF